MSLTKRGILISTYVLYWLFLYYGLPREIYHMGHGLLRWFPAISILLILPILFFYIVRRTIATLFAMILAANSVFLAIPFTLIMGAEDGKEFNKNNLETNGVITKSVYDKRNSKWNVFATYYVDGRKYTTSAKEDKFGLLQMDDEVTIIYSTKVPQMSKIKELHNE